MIKGVIFDMDGVLVDNRDAHIESFVEFCKRYGIDISGQDLSWMYGMGNDEILPRMLPAEIIEREGVEKLAREKEELYREIYSKTIKPTPGLIDFLNDIRANGIKTSVGSSGSTVNVDFVLEKCGITDMFDAIVDGDMVEHAKPAPDIFLLAAKLLSLDPADCLVIEDSLAGIEASKRAGIRCVGMATTLPREKLPTQDTVMIVDDFRQLSYDKIMEF